MTCDLQAIRERVESIRDMRDLYQEVDDMLALLAEVDRLADEYDRLSDDYADADDALRMLGRISSAREANEARLRAAIEQHRRGTHYRLDQPHNVGHGGQPIAKPTNSDERLWAALENNDG